MSWNEVFYWFAILSFSLALAQLGISNISPTLYETLFGHKPNTRIREIMRRVPNFLGVLSILALVLAVVAGLRLIMGLGGGLALVIAEHFGYSGNTAFMALTLAVSYSILVGFVFIALRTIWRLAARLPSRNLDTQGDTGTINAEIQRHLKEIRQGNPKTKDKKHDKK
jgi:hypothetical protein